MFSLHLPIAGWRDSDQGPTSPNQTATKPLRQCWWCITSIIFMMYCFSVRLTVVFNASPDISIMLGCLSFFSCYVKVRLYYNQGHNIYISFLILLVTWNYMKRCFTKQYFTLLFLLPCVPFTFMVVTEQLLSDSSIDSDLL